ncbi:MAG: glycosyltransferase family 2 protein [Myxococcales bacterium]
MLRRADRWGLFDATLGLQPLVGMLLCSLPIFAGVRELAGRAAGLEAGLLAVALHPVPALLSIQALYFAFETLLWLRYRPFQATAGAPLPRLSVVIPAFNEGPMVVRSIRSVAQADYPHELLEILVVDDGSRDDTYFHMEALRRQFPGLVRLLRFRGNRGKRAALLEGFEAARGEVVLTIDSDSEMERDTLRAMVAPFQCDPKVGAVAGRVTVLNRETLIGAMLDVNYALTFDFGRAAQSTFRAVACCPGALSAFRLEAIRPHLAEWAEQRFLGRPVCHGEDQALTNLVLRGGYDTVYQRTAIVRTLAPKSYRQLTRMFLRWDRSFVVEGFSFARFMFKRYRPQRRLLPALHFVMGNLRLVLLYAGLLQLPLLLLEHPGSLWRIGTSLFIAALFTALYYVRSDRSFRFLYGVVYAFYSALLLQWILPWAIMTVRDDRWGTR